MTETKAALSTFNMLTFKDEAHLNLWIHFWEKHGDNFFESLKISSAGVAPAKLASTGQLARRAEIALLYSCAGGSSIPTCRFKRSFNLNSILRPPNGLRGTREA